MKRRGGICSADWNFLRRTVPLLGQRIQKLVNTARLVELPIEQGGARQEFQGVGGAKKRYGASGVEKHRGVLSFQVRDAGLQQVCGGPPFNVCQCSEIRPAPSANRVARVLGFASRAFFQHGKRPFPIRCKTECPPARRRFPWPCPYRFRPRLPLNPRAG